MEQVFTEGGDLLDSNKFEFLTDQGSEFIVYKYLGLVIKIYKKDYKLSHLTLEDLNILKNIKTNRILLPSDTLWNANNELIGYMMPYIAGTRNLYDYSLQSFIGELEIIKDDLDLLSKEGIILRDINLSNIIFNGQLYLIDPGNYLVGELDKIVFGLINLVDSKLASRLHKILIEEDSSKIKPMIDSLPKEIKDKILKLWNYNKINELINMLLFSKHPNIDPFKYRQIVQFIKKERENNDFIYTLDVLKKYFDSSLSIDDAINDFLKRCIKDNPRERKIYHQGYY